MRKKSNFQTLKFKIMSYYSRHYSNSAVTIQIRGTIQNRNMNSARALTREWLRHPNFLLFKALTIG